MTLGELLSASLLFCGCSLASLQLWLLISLAGQAEERLQSLREQVDAELVGLEGALAAAARSQIPAADCGAGAAQMLRVLEARPLPSGLRRQLRSLPEGSLLQVELDAEALEEPRLRWYSAAGLGYCAPPEPSGPAAGAG